MTGQEVVLPLSHEWYEPALCLFGVTWLEALWRCRVVVIKAHELAADENARAQISESSRLRPGNHVALRLTKAENTLRARLALYSKGRMLSSMLIQLASLPTFVVSPRGTWPQVAGAAPNV